MEERICAKCHRPWYPDEDEILQAWCVRCRAGKPPEPAEPPAKARAGGTNKPKRNNLRGRD